MAAKAVGDEYRAVRDWSQLRNDDGHFHWSQEPDRKTSPQFPRTLPTGFGKHRGSHSRRLRTKLFPSVGDG